MKVIEDGRCPVHDCPLELDVEPDEYGYHDFFWCSVGKHTYPARSNRFLGVHFPIDEEAD